MHSYQVNFVCGSISPSPAERVHDVIVAEIRTAGTLVDQQNVDGDTLLHVASRMGHATTVRALLTAGASAGVKNRAGLTPLDEATNHAHADVVRLLRGANAGNAADMIAACQLA